MSPTPNPFAAPQTVAATAASPRSLPYRVAYWVSVVVAAYPLLLVALVFVTWACAVVSLGHLPRPSLNDPKGIPLAAFPHLVLMVLAAGSPLAWFAAVPAVPMVVHHRLTKRQGNAAIPTMLWWSLVGYSLVALCWWSLLLYARNDPGEVLTWILD